MAISVSKRRRHDGVTRYRAQIRVKGHASKSRTFSRKAAARQWAERVQDDLRALPPGRHEPHTVSDAIERYRRERLPEMKSRQHRAAHLDWWQEEFGDLLLQDVTPPVIAERLDTLRSTPTARGDYRKAATINRAHAAMSAVFRETVKRWHWLEENPCLRVRRLPEPKGRTRWLSDDERTALLTECKRSAWAGLYPLVLLALATGARRGELMSLCWADVDLKRGTLYVRTSKNDEPRMLPIRGPARQALTNWSKVRRLKVDLVFPSGHGKTPLEFRRHWQKAIKRAELTDFRFHDLRHSCASYLAQNGASVIEIADILGHRTLEMVKRYSHLNVEHRAWVLERMNESVFGKD